MTGILITTACIIGGTLLGIEDLAAGVALIVVGGLAGIAIAWQELS